MSILVDSAKEAQYREGYIYVYMESGVEIRFPVKGNRRLAQGTTQQLNNIELSPYGLHWPDLDEDLSFSGLLRGDYGQYIGTRTGPCAESAFDDVSGRPYGTSPDAVL
jgi:hypothetical protein